MATPDVLLEELEVKVNHSFCGEPLELMVTAGFGVYLSNRTVQFVQLAVLLIFHMLSTRWLLRTIR